MSLRVRLRVAFRWFLFIVLIAIAVVLRPFLGLLRLFGIPRWWPSSIWFRVYLKTLNVRVVEHGGREALTEIRPLESSTETSLIEVRIRTGVRHQIRATLAFLGHPVVGDSRYGSPVVRPRHSLHASVLALDDFRAEAPLPADF